jgi:hypothetical protein
MENETYSGYDKVIRDLINQETTLVNTRMSWLLIVQGLLFSGCSQFYDKNLLCSIVLSVVGLCVSLGMKFSFWSSEKAIALILTYWDRYISVNNLSYDDFPPVWAGAGWKLSKKEKLMIKYCGFLQSHTFLPYIFTGAWIIIIFSVMTIK